MNILCIGDIVGRNGAEMLAGQLRYLKQDYDIDFVIANGENANTGNGINRKRADFLLDAGVDVITLGNHAFSKPRVTELFNDGYPIIRPANMTDVSGPGYIIRTVCGKKICVINLIGRVFMREADCPFETANNLISGLDADIYIIDFHAEATSEKQALGWYLDGRAACVFGTHTHTQTADERILPAGTAYITDIGMTGPMHSCLGVDKNIVIDRFVKCSQARFEFADSAPMISGAVFSVDEKTGKWYGCLCESLATFYGSGGLSVSTIDRKTVSCFLWLYQSF